MVSRWVNGPDYILGIAPTATLRRASVRRSRSQHEGEIRWRPRRETASFVVCWSSSTARKAGAGSRVIIARVEAGAEGPDTRFVVTNLEQPQRSRALRGCLLPAAAIAENHIKSWKTHLAADRTSCSRATANQFRLFLHTGAHWLMWGLRVSMPKRSMWRVAQFDTLRLSPHQDCRRVVEMKTLS